MPFGIPSEDFHGGFGIPHEEESDYDRIKREYVEHYTDDYISPKEEIYEDVIFGLNELLGGMADQGCMLDDELDRWCELMRKFRKAKGFE